jgi:hypothetical protein
MDVLIKNVNEDNWHFLKVEAAKERKTMGNMFNKLVEELKKKEKDDIAAWERIFSRKPLLTKKQAKRMHKHVATFRKEYGFEG